MNHSKVGILVASIDEIESHLSQPYSSHHFLIDNCSSGLKCATLQDPIKDSVFFSKFRSRTSRRQEEGASSVLWMHRIRYFGNNHPANVTPPEFGEYASMCRRRCPWKPWGMKELTVRSLLRNLPIGEYAILTTVTQSTLFQLWQMGRWGMQIPHNIGGFLWNSWWVADNKIHHALHAFEMSSPSAYFLWLTNMASHPFYALP